MGPCLSKLSLSAALLDFLLDIVPSGFFQLVILKPYVAPGSAFTKP